MNPARYCKECGCYVPDNNNKCLACGYDMNLPALPTCGSRIYSPTKSFINTPSNISQYYWVENESHMYYLPNKAGTVAFINSSDRIFYNTGTGCGWMRIQ